MTNRLARSPVAPNNTKTVGCSSGLALPFLFLVAM